MTGTQSPENVPKVLKKLLITCLSFVCGTYKTNSDLVESTYNNAIKFLLRHNFCSSWPLILIYTLHACNEFTEFTNKETMILHIDFNKNSTVDHTSYKHDTSTYSNSSNSNNSIA